MASIALLYGTGEGQTAKVAHRIADTLTERGHTLTERDVSAGTEDLNWNTFDAVVVGASIHTGQHQSSVRELIAERLDYLNDLPTAFFQISLSSATPEGREQAASYVDELLENTGWDPDRIGLFGGALQYSRYGFLKRLLIKQIAKRNIPDVETDTDVEFTDWDEVESFSNDFADFVEGRIQSEVS